MSHVFISYKHDDAHFVDSLREKLKAAEIDSWLDTDIEAGEDWKQRIDTAIEAAFAIVVVLTPESHQSPYVTYEWSYAMGLGKQIVPVLLRKTDRHPKLEAKQYIDFTERKSPEKALVERLHSLEKSYSPSVHSQRSQNTAWEYQHIKPVIDDLDSEDEDTRIAAAITLGELKVVEALEPLMRCLRDKNLEVQLAATRALGRLRAEKAVPSLVTLANRKTIDIELKKELLSSLAQIGGKNALDFLRLKLISEEKHQWIFDSTGTSAVIEAINIHGRSVITKQIKSSLKLYIQSRFDAINREIQNIRERVLHLANMDGDSPVKNREQLDLLLNANEFVLYKIQYLNFFEIASHDLGIFKEWMDVRWALDDLREGFKS